VDYLDWLSKGRREDLISSDLVMLFLEGLTYRYKKEEKDKEFIEKEVLELLNIYGDKSVRIKEQITFMIELFTQDQEFIKKYSVREFSDIFLKKYYFHNDNLRYHLLWKFMNNKGIKITTNKSIYYFLKNDKFIKNIKKYKDFELIKKFYDTLLSEKNILDKEISVLRIESDKEYANYKMKVIDFNIDNLELERTFKTVISNLRSYFLDKKKKRDDFYSYSYLPVKVKHIWKHPFHDKIINIMGENTSLIISPALLYKKIFNESHELLSLKQSKLLEKVLNDNFIAVESSAIYFNKAYSKNEKIIIYKKKHHFICKNNNYKILKELSELFWRFRLKELSYEDKKELISVFFTIVEPTDGDFSRLRRKFELLVDYDYSRLSSIKLLDKQKSKIIKFLKSKTDLYNSEEILKIIE
jgi:hypothetical protein